MELGDLLISLGIIWSCFKSLPMKGRIIQAMMGIFPAVSLNSMSLRILTGLDI